MFFQVLRADLDVLRLHLDFPGLVPRERAAQQRERFARAGGRLDEGVLALGEGGEDLAHGDLLGDVGLEAVGKVHHAPAHGRAGAADGGWRLGEDVGARALGGGPLVVAEVVRGAARATRLRTAGAAAERLEHRARLLRAQILTSLLRAPGRSRVVRPTRILGRVGAVGALVAQIAGHRLERGHGLLRRLRRRYQLAVAAGIEKLVHPSLDARRDTRAEVRGVREWCARQLVRTLAPPTGANNLKIFDATRLRNARRHLARGRWRCGGNIGRLAAHPSAAKERR